MRKTEKKSSKAAFFALAALTPILIILLAFSSAAYDSEFILKHMQKAGSGQHSALNSQVVHYLASPAKGLIMSDYFDDNEEQHLLDVKILMHRTFGCLFFLLILFFALLRYNYIHFPGNIPKALFYGGIAAAAIPAVLYFLPFDFLFVLFHRIFFEDGTWIFWKSSMLIQAYPAEFWQSISFSIFARAVFAGAAAALLSAHAMISSRK